MYTWLRVLLLLILILTLIIGLSVLWTCLNNPNNQRLKDLLRSTKKDAIISDIVGTWDIDDPRYPIKRLVMSSSTIGGVADKEAHYLGCGSCNSKPVGSVKVPTETLVFRTGFLPSALKKSVEDLSYIYKIVLHKNGIVKFVLHPDLNIMQDILAVRGDSKSNFGVILNFIHRIRYGCFCLGLLSPDGKTIKRYNRWADKYPDKYYTMRKVSTI